MQVNLTTNKFLFKGLKRLIRLKSEIVETFIPSISDKSTFPQVKTVNAVINIKIRI